MSIKIMASVWEHSPQRGTSLLLLLALSNYANEYGECWPSIGRLAHDCRQSERYTQILLRKLEAAGELTIIYRGDQGRTSLYTVITPEARRRGEDDPQFAPRDDRRKRKGTIRRSPDPSVIRQNGEDDSKYRSSNVTTSADDAPPALKELL
jgi:hypothetical protein